MLSRHGAPAASARRPRTARAPPWRDINRRHVSRQWLIRRPLAVTGYRGAVRLSGCRRGPRLVDDLLDARANRRGIETEQRVGLDHPLLDSPAASKIDDRIDRPRAVGLEGERQSVIRPVVTEPVDEGRERDDPLVAWTVARIEGNHVGEVRPLMPELRCGR